MKKLFMITILFFGFIVFPTLTVLGMDTYTPNVATENNGNRTLSAKDVGDTSDWIEIARCNGCSLILRVQPLENNQPSFRYTDNGIFAYKDSNAYNKLLHWYFFGANLKTLKEHVINCDAERKLGYFDDGYSYSARIADGFSVPLESGETPVFLLSHQEMEKYLFSEYGKNYEKLKNMLTQKARGFFGRDKCLDTGIGYLRTPGRNHRYVSCNWFGEEDRDVEISEASLYKEKLSLRPALWVKNSIFETKIWSQVECYIGPLNPFLYERDLMSQMREKLTQELIKKERFQEFGENLHFMLIGGTPKDRESIAYNILKVYGKARLVSENFFALNESNFSGAFGSGVCFFDTERALSITSPPRATHALAITDSSTKQSVADKLLSLMDKKNCAVVLGGSEESKNKFLESNPKLKEKLDSANIVYLNKEEPYCYAAVAKQCLAVPDEKPLCLKGLSRPKISINDCLTPLGSLVGMENFKYFIRGLIISEKQRNIDAKYGIMRKKPTLHMIITGNPGTGKTTVVRMLGKILFDAGLIDREEVVSVERVDLVDSVVGGSEALTKQKLAQAKGGILFIDEAYALTDGNGGHGDNDFGRRVIEGLLNPLTGDDCAIILAGYPDKMKQFVEFNPGLTRRFAPDHRILLLDYTSRELFEIFNNLCIKCGLSLESGSESVLINHFEVMKKAPNFGNAGYAEKLFEKVMKNRDFDWQEIMGEDCDELTEKQIADRKFIKLKHINDAAKEFECALI